MVALSVDPLTEQPLPADAKVTAPSPDPPETASAIAVPTTPGVDAVDTDNVAWAAAAEAVAVSGDVTTSPLTTGPLPSTPPPHAARASTAATSNAAALVNLAGADCCDCRAPNAAMRVRPS